MIGAMRCRLYRRRLARSDGAASETPAHRHVRSCRACQSILHEQDLITAQLADLELGRPAGAQLWRRIEAQLDRGETTGSRRARPGSVGSAMRWLLHDSPIWAVATVAVVAVLGLWQASEWAESRDRSVPATVTDRNSPGASTVGPSGKTGLGIATVPLKLDVGGYVQEISASTGPEGFWHVYRARTPESTNPYGSLDFEPLVPDRLPHGFALVDSKLLRDACCQTLQLRYRSADRWVDVFQCHVDHPIEFGQARVGRRDVSGIVCTAFDWDEGRVRGRSFQLGDLSLVALGNVSDDVLDDIVTELGER